MTTSRAKTHLLEVMEYQEAQARRIEALERELVMKLDELRLQHRVVGRLQKENAELKSMVSTGVIHEG